MWLLIALAVFLALYNNVTNLLGLPEAAYVPLNLAVTAAIVAAARAGRWPWAVLGLTARGLGPGLRWGLGVAAVAAAGLGLALAVPWLRALLADERLAGVGLAGLAYQALVRIPLGTVVLEEVAFRGVLLGVWAERRTLREALFGAAVLFGLWHIGPTIVLLEANAIATAPLARGAAVAAAVAATAAAGVLFSLLRLRTGGVAGPAVAHASLNGLAAAAAVAAHQLV